MKILTDKLYAQDNILAWPTVKKTTCRGSTWPITMAQSCFLKLPRWCIVPTRSAIIWNLIRRLFASQNGIIAAALANPELSSVGFSSRLWSHWSLCWLKLHVCLCIYCFLLYGALWTFSLRVFDKVTVWFYCWKRTPMLVGWHATLSVKVSLFLHRHVDKLWAHGWLQSSAPQGLQRGSPPFFKYTHSIIFPVTALSCCSPTLAHTSLT